MYKCSAVSEVAVQMKFSPKKLGLAPTKVSQSELMAYKRSYLTNQQSQVEVLNRKTLST